MEVRNFRTNKKRRQPGKWEKKSRKIVPYKLKDDGHAKSGDISPMSELLIEVIGKQE